MTPKKRVCLVSFLAAALIALFAVSCSLSGADAPRKNILKPYISVQPQSASYYNEEYGDKPELVYKAPPKLSIEIWDWSSKDGKLSFQWYTFNDIEDYCATGGTAISGADDKEYTPTQLDPTDDKTINYYYVIVTNTNKDAADVKTAKTQSEVAAIAFSKGGDPLVPVISRNPASANYAWGATLNSLQVKASAPDAGILSYQWFTNDDYSVKDGTPVPSADQAMMIPDQRTLKVGTPNYAYVVVTNTRTPLSKQAISIPAIINLEPGKKVAEPRINGQPKDFFYFTGDEVQPLEVDAESPDNGVLSYQWYSNTIASNKKSADRIPISGENAATYTPDIDTDTAGTYYYCVDITNNNDNVKDKTPMTIASKAVVVRVGTKADEALINRANAFFTINPEKKYQYIRGYGGMDVAWGNFPRTTQKDTHLMYDPEQLGYNMLRIMIKANYVDPAKTVDELIAGDRPDYFENVKIVNGYGGYVAASPWTPPKDWKSNNSINGGGILLPGYYKLFANYLRNFAQYMYNNGAPIYVISISNEPNYVAGYDGCEWTSNEARDFFKQVGHFTDGIRGWGGGRETPYVLTMNGESANTPNWNIAALADPISKAAIDVLARHIYGSRTDSLWNQNKRLITKKDAAGNDVFMEVWMTEHNINSANATGYYNDSTWNYVWRFMNDVDLVIRMNNENAFVWWASKRFYSMVGDGQFGATDGDPLPRGWGLSHYSRYSIDTYRIGVDLAADKTSRTKSPDREIRHLDEDNSVVNQSKDEMDNVSPRITAFLDAEGKYVSVVLWTPTEIGKGGTDMGTIELRLPFAASGVTAHRSWGDEVTQLFQEDHSVALSEDRKSAYVTLGVGELLSIKFTK